jgi:uncharacterized ion transporter superfamily protein YfcC
LVIEKNTGQKRRTLLLHRAVKATIKGVIIYIFYFVLSLFLAPLSEFVPGFQQTIETFATIYIILVIVAELTSGSILQHFFNGAKALFVIACIIVSLGTGTFSLTFQNFSLLVDIRVFLTIAMMLSLLGLANSVLQTIDHVNEKAEIELN